MNYQGEDWISSPEATSDSTLDAFFRHIILLTKRALHCYFPWKDTAWSLSQWSPLEICHILHQGNDISLTQHHKGTQVVSDHKQYHPWYDTSYTNLSCKFLFPRNKHFGELAFINCYFTKLYIYTDIICQSLCSLDSIQLSPELLHRTLNFPLWQFLPCFS